MIFWRNGFKFLKELIFWIKFVHLSPTSYTFQALIKIRDCILKIDALITYMILCKYSRAIFLEMFLKFYPSIEKKHVSLGFTNPDHYIFQYSSMGFLPFIHHTSSFHHHSSFRGSTTLCINFGLTAWVIQSQAKFIDQTVDNQSA